MRQFFTSDGQSFGVSASAISPSSEYSGLSSFRIDWFDLLVVQGTLKFVSRTIVLKQQFFGAQPFCYPALTSVHDYWKTIALAIWTFVSKVMSLLLT